MYDDLIRQGKIRSVGLSNHPAWQVTHALWIADDRRLASAPVAAEVKYNLIDRAAERELSYACEQFGVSIVPYSPLHGGLLADLAVLDRDVAGDQRFGARGRSQAASRDASVVIPPRTSGGRNRLVIPPLSRRTSDADRWGECLSASIPAVVIHSHPEVDFVGCGLGREGNVLHVDVAQLLEHVGDSTEKSGYITLTCPDGLETENGTRSNDRAHPRQRPSLRAAM